MQITTVMAKALLSKIVRHAIAGDTIESRINRGELLIQRGELSQHQLEGIGLMHTAAQFFIVPRHTKDFKIAVNQLFRKNFLAGQIETEPLSGHSKAILHAAVAHIIALNTGQLSQ